VRICSASADQLVCLAEAKIAPRAADSRNGPGVLAATRIGGRLPRRHHRDVLKR
jgi:hypothetical protein